MSAVKNTPDSKRSFFKAHILPLLFVFLIPGFSFWFFDRAEKNLDAEARKSVLAKVAADSRLTESQRAEYTSLFQTMVLSKAMASSDPKAAGFQKSFAPTANRYTNFRWGKRVALTCIAASVFALLFVSLCVVYSLRSQAALYRALRVGWATLRCVAVIEVIGQGALAVSLSFWVTALWFESYSIKLIAVIGLLALFGIAAIVAAIFSKSKQLFEQDGEVISESDAPALWSRVREIAARMETAPPDQIATGIDASFYVTEHDFTIGGKTLTGRTLFVSLPLLKVLTAEEADAVLAHEMAHFSGNDTLWSRRISPYLGEMNRYLKALYAGGLTRPVFYFLHSFWKLYQYSLGRMSRAREFRADRFGSEITSPSAASNALVKITAYCGYRNRTENEIMAKSEIETELELAARLDRGFSAYLAGFTGNSDSAFAEIVHPFDSHPPLSKRVEALGIAPAQALGDPSVHHPVADSWRDAILPAAQIEARLWKEREKFMHAVHEENRAWTLPADTPENVAVITKHFPTLTFESKKGKTAAITHHSLRLSDWPGPLEFSTITGATLKDSYGTKTLILKYTEPDSGKAKTLKFVPADYKNSGGNLLQAFERYYGRHKNAQRRLER